MTITMYEIAVPSFRKHLEALDAILDKAIVYAETRKIDPETLPLSACNGQRSGSLEITVAEITAEGRIYTHQEYTRLTIPEAEWARTIQQGVSYARRWKPRSDAARVRVLVRVPDSWQTGTLDIPIRGLLP